MTDTALHMAFSGFGSKRFPRHAIMGLAIVIASEALLFSRVPLIGIYFTPLVWTGYILFVDALNLQQHGSSFMVTRPRAFLALLPWSIVCWCIFEAYNIYLQNWTYIGLPENRALRYLGYGWAFATIIPAVLETNDLIARYFSQPHDGTMRLSPATLTVSVLSGLCCLIIPLAVAQSVASQLFGLVWLGFFLLLDPINSLLKGRSLIRDMVMGKYDLAIGLVCSGIICGVLWEFWNYWASAKWVYSVPLSIAGPKLFEMPLLGYAGFIPFAFECFVFAEFCSLMMPLALRDRPT